MHRYFVVVTIILLMLPGSYATAQQKGNEKDAALTELEKKVADLEWKLEQVERNTSDLSKEAKDYAPIGLVLVLYGAFCALWAQNTGHHTWTWFLLGVLFSVFTVIAILTGHRRDYRDRK